MAEDRTSLHPCTWSIQPLPPKVWLWNDVTQPLATLSYPSSFSLPSSLALGTEGGLRASVAQGVLRWGAGGSPYLQARHCPKGPMSATTFPSQPPSIAPPPFPALCTPHPPS